MAERKYRPGTRKHQFAEGKISEQRLAWLQTYIGQFVIMKYDSPFETENEDTEVEPGPTIRLMLPQQRGRSLLFNFTSLTHAELVELKRLFDMLFEMTEPIVIDRDKAAQDAYDRGDDSFTRIYRTVPQLVVRARQGGPNSEGIHERSDNVLPGDRSAGDNSGGVPVSGDELAEREPSHSSAQDDLEEADQSSDVR